MTKQEQGPSDGTSAHVRLRLQEFRIPPIRDCLVVGRDAPIGCRALQKALSLLHGEPFEDLHPKDDVVSDILIRANILRRLSREKLIRLILTRIKPLMGADEIADVSIEVEVFLEDEV